MKIKKDRLCLRLPQELNKQLANKSEEQYISKNSLVIQILNEYFDRKKEEASRSGQSRKTQENA